MISEGRPTGRRLHEFSATVCCKNSIYDLPRKSRIQIVRFRKSERGSKLEEKIFSNFTHYKHRFSMPGSEAGMYYSFDIGPAHIISFSTEFYYYVYFGIKQIWHQYKWLIRDLEEANKPENRAKRPWIITMGHRFAEYFKVAVGLI